LPVLTLTAPTLNACVGVDAIEIDQLFERRLETVGIVELVASMAPGGSATALAIAA